MKRRGMPQTGKQRKHFDVSLCEKNFAPLAYTDANRMIGFHEHDVEGA